MFKCKTILILITGVLFFGIPVFPAVHYVSTNGTGTWAQSTNENTPCSMPVANTNASAGDTVYIKAGTYNNYIAPVHSGTSAANAIIYRNYETDTVTISDASYGISLNGKSYIIVQGIDFYNLDKFLWLQNSANHNTVAYCNFDQGRNIGWSGSKIYRNSSYNRVMHCRFSKYGYYTDDDIGCILDVGNENSTTDLTGNNLLEDCVFFHGGHHILGVYGMRNVIRNCYFHNEPWAMGTSASDRGAVLYGNRNISVSGYVENSGRNLFEGNSIAYSSDPSDNVGASGMSLTTSNNIVRMNRYYNNDCAGLSMTLTSSYLQNIRHNKIYNNSFFNNGHNPDAYIRAKTGIFFAIYSGPRVIEHNIIKNNILYKHRIPFDEYNINTSDRRGLITQQIFMNNWDGDTQGDPIFADATITFGDPTDSTWPDFNLESNSPCIDAGGSLTTITTASGSGMSFTVDDAGYFMDGWGIVDGDTIQLEGQTQTAQITDVNYDTNIITVDISLTWNKGQGISLAYEGSAPDAGAYEYMESGQNIIPPSRSNPDNFTLQQNYPNPFNPSTTIKYSVAKSCNVQIKIYNRLGQEVCALVNKQISAGEHSITWDGKDAKGNKLASGIYYYRLTAGKQSFSKKMLYLR